MEMTPARQRRLRLQGLFTVVLVVVLALLAGFLAWSYRAQWDLTQNARNTLSQESREVLASIPGPVRVTAFATERDPELGDLRKRIRDFIGRYQQAKADLQLEFVNPELEPKRTRDAGIQMNGEMMVEYEGRAERFSPFNLNEQAFTNLLIRLARTHERVVFYLEGHGERSLTGQANHDLGEFGRRLTATGFKLNPLKLALVQEVPVNTALLVIGSPQAELLPGEVEKLLKFVDRGGNLLWLLDPESLGGLEPLAERLGLNLLPGVIVDPAAEEMRAPATWALAASYGHHPATDGFNLLTVFPLARPITVGEDTDWRSTSLVEVAPRGWVETGSLEGAMRFDPKRDLPGPVPIATALERTRNDREQRVVVVGSGAFLANAFVGNGANLDLGLKLVNWLAGDEHLVTIQPKAARDAQLQLTRPAALAITMGGFILLPLGFLALAAVVWWRRRRL